MKSIFLATLLSANLLPANAADTQPLPPACAQYVTLYRACTTNYVKYLELTNPALAEKFRPQQNAQGLEQAMRAELQKSGPQVTAQTCANPEMKRALLVDYYPNVIAPLIMAQAVDSACQSAFGALR